jgi:hypothetical protein
MAAYFRVFCRRSVAHLTAADLLAAIHDLDDIHSIAEGYDIDDDDEIDEALSRLRIEPTDEVPGLKFRLRYRPGDGRPILIYLATDPEQVREESREALEGLPRPEKHGPKGPHVHLGRVAEIVALELGWDQLDDMGIVFAAQIAQYFAVVGEGLLEDQDGAWWAVQEGVPVHLAGPEDDA